MSIRRTQPAFPGFPGDLLQFPRLQLRGSAGISPASLSFAERQKTRIPKDMEKNEKTGARNLMRRWWGSQMLKIIDPEGHEGLDLDPRFRGDCWEYRAELRSAGQPGAAVPTWASGSRGIRRCLLFLRWLRRTRAHDRERTATRSGNVQHLRRWRPRGRGSACRCAS